MDGVPAIALILGAAWLWFSTQTKAAGNLIFYPYTISGISFNDPVNPVITLVLLIQNTSNSSFTVYSLGGNVYTETNLVGNISNFTAFTIPANAETKVPIYLRMEPIGIVNDIISAITTQHITKKLTVTGSYNANGAQLPLSLSFDTSLYGVI